MKSAAQLVLSSLIAFLLLTCSPAPLNAQAGGSGLSTFTSSSAGYLFTSPTGSYTDISAYTGVSSLTPSINDHDGGYDYPIQYTDGTHGTTTFDDYYWYSHTEDIPVPNITSTGGFFPATGTDGHLIVIDTATRMAYDFWRLYTNGSGTPITCSGNHSATSIGYINDYSLNTSNGNAGGGTASGLSGLAGDLLPGEIEAGNAAPHALLVTVPSGMMNPNICDAAPANNTDGSVVGAVFCEGAKIRMDPSVDVDSLTASPAAKGIMKTLQTYGGIISDQSCSTCLGIYSNIGTSPDTTGLATNLLAHLWIYYSH